MLKGFASRAGDLAVSVCAAMRLHAHLAKTAYLRKRRQVCYLCAWQKALRDHSAAAVLGRASADQCLPPT